MVDRRPLRGCLRCRAAGAVARPAGVRAARGGTRRGGGVGGGALGIRHRRRSAQRPLVVDPGARRRPRAALRRARAAHGADRGRHRRTGDDLLRGLLRAGRAAARGLRGQPDRVRRSHARAHPRRRPDRPVRPVGTHHGLLLPPHRPRLRTQDQPARRPPGAAGHHARRAGDVRRLPDAGPGRRHLPDLPDVGRPTAPFRARRGRAGARAGGGAVEVRRMALQLLAAGGDGRADTRLRVPARRGHGQGRDLPDRAARPRLRRRGALAGARPGARRRDDAARRLAGASGDGPETAAGLRNRQPAGLPHPARGRRHPGRGAGRYGDDPGARPVQGPALPRRRHHRPCHRHPGPQPALRSGPFTAVGVRGRHARRALHDGPAAAARVRRQGGVRLLAPARRAGRVRGVGGGDRGVGADDRLHAALLVGRLRTQGRLAATGTGDRATRRPHRSPHLLAARAVRAVRARARTRRRGTRPAAGPLRRRLSPGGRGLPPRAVARLRPGAGALRRRLGAGGRRLPRRPPPRRARRHALAGGRRPGVRPLPVEPGAALAPADRPRTARLAACVPGYGARRTARLRGSTAGGRQTLVGPAAAALVRLGAPTRRRHRRGGRRGAVRDGRTAAESGRAGGGHGVRRRRAVRTPRGAGPGADPVRRRDRLADRLRARPAQTPRPLPRRGADVAAAAGGPAALLRRVGRAGRRAHPPHPRRARRRTLGSPAAGGHLPRGPQERRRHHPGRPARLGHHGRVGRPGRRRHRRHQPRLPAPPRPRARGAAGARLRGHRGRGGHGRGRDRRLRERRTGRRLGAAHRRPQGRVEASRQTRRTRPQPLARRTPAHLARGQRHPGARGPLGDVRGDGPARFSPDRGALAVPAVLRGEPARRRLHLGPGGRTGARRALPGGRPAGTGRRRARGRRLPARPGTADPHRHRAGRALPRRQRAGLGNGARPVLARREVPRGQPRPVRHRRVPAGARRRPRRPAQPRLRDRPAHGARAREAGPRTPGRPASPGSSGAGPRGGGGTS